MVEAKKINTTLAKSTRPSPAAAAKTTGGAAAARCVSKSKITGAQRDNFECPVCLLLCVQPVVSPCKHFMCFECHKKCMKAGIPCPMCRAHFDKLFIPQVDRELQEEIAAAMGAEFEERKAEVIAAGEGMGNKRLIKFSFGNTHEDVKNPKGKNSHRWCMFASLAQGADETGKFIKSVTYHLHPTFTPSKIKVEKAPFLLSRVGWGWFDIQMDIEFKESTGLGTKRITHELCFDGKGKTQSFLMEVAAESDAEVAAALAAEFAKLDIKASKK